MSAYEDDSTLLGDNSADGYVEPTGCGASLPCDPRRRLHRFLVLILICFLSFGSYFCYDNPAAMQDIMISDLDLTYTQYMNFYAFYSWPNVVLSFAGGFLIDRVFGIRLGAIIFGLFVLLGQLIFAAGSFTKTVWVMYLARFVFGIGGESLAVAQNTYASSWFKDNELNFIFGLQLSMSRIGSTVNMNSMQPLYKALPDTLKGNTRLGWSLLIAAGTCLFSLACCICLAYFDRRAKKILAKGVPQTGEVIKVRDIKTFSPALWILCVICVAYYVAVFPFISLGLVFFERKFMMGSSSADAVNSLVYIVSAAASPIMGILIDYFGHNLLWVMTGILTTMGCHALLAFTFSVSPYIIMVFLGISYSILASSLWPLVVFIIPAHQRGTAYGIMQSVQNLGLGVISIAAGAIVDAKGYLILEVFFMAWLCVAFLFTVLLYLYNSSVGGRLNESGSVRRERVKMEESQVDSEESSEVIINT